MYNQVKVAADVTNNTTTYANLGLMSVTVEEDEMWVDISLQAVASNNTAGEGVEFDFLIDGTLVGGAGTPLAACANSTLANSVGTKFPVRVGTKVRLTKGTHVIAGQFRRTANASTATINATAYPAILGVLRLSNNALLAHGMGAKFQVTQ
jgi:hypothetical protein